MSAVLIEDTDFREICAITGLNDQNDHLLRLLVGATEAAYLKLKVVLSRRPKMSSPAELLRIIEAKEVEVYGQKFSAELHRERLQEELAQRQDRQVLPSINRTFMFPCQFLASSLLIVHCVLCQVQFV